MSRKTVDIHDAETHLSRLIAPVEREARIAIARAGKPVAELRPTRKVKKRLDDPLLRVNEYSYNGPILTTDDEGINRTVYT